MLFGIDAGHVDRVTLFSKVGISRAAVLREGKKKK